MSEGFNKKVQNLVRGINFYFDFDQKDLAYQVFGPIIDRLAVKLAEQGWDHNGQNYIIGGKEVENSDPTWINKMCSTLAKNCPICTYPKGWM